MTTLAGSRSLERRLVARNLRHIVLVDDRQEDLQQARLVLQRAHPLARIQTFGKGGDALDWLMRIDAPEVDLILLAVDPAGTDGLQFMQAYEDLHASQRARAVVAMLSTSLDPEGRQRALNHAGIRHCVLKPIGAVEAQALVWAAG